MHKRNTIAGEGHRSRFLIAVTILALVALVPLSSVAGPIAAAPSSATPAARAAAAVPAVPAAPAKAASQAGSEPAVRPNPDQVPLVAFTAPGTGARLVVSAPTSVAVGQTLTVLLKAIGVRNLAGYEGVLRFDSAAAEFDSLSQRAIALAGSGRDVQPLGPVVIPSGVAFGLYSCSIAGCGAGSTTSAAHPGVSGTVVLAKLTLLPTRAGNLSIALGSMRFVDAAGKLITISLPGAISVKVGAGTQHFAAPAAPALRAGAAHAVTTADISGDGFVGPADLNSAAIAWGRARESGRSCGLVNDPADLNHDGCLDVQDVQLIAARVAPRPASAALAPAVALTFTVNSTSDVGDKNPGDGICATSANVCSLRAAITEANLHAGPDNINFNIPGGGVQTISIATALPTITDITGGVTIDGYTQPGASPNTDPLISNAQIKVQITSANPNTDGIFVSSSNNLIRGLSMYNLHRSIVFQTVNAKNNAVTGSFIGTNAAGTFVAPNWISGGNGIIVTQAASYTTVGGTNPADRDVLSGNQANGFSTYNEQTDHNVVQGNLIGLGPNGQDILSCSGVCYGQLSHGVDINTGSSYNIIGGTGPGQRNVISNNRGEGIEFSHSDTTDSNQAIGNYIGTDVTGNAGAANKFGNGWNGIHLEDGVTGSILAFNVIGNNALRTDNQEVTGGIGIEGFYTAGTSVHDNKVGVGLDGVTPLPNSFYGIVVHFNASWTTVGPNNIIANNPIGVSIADTSDIYNTITGNSIYNNGSAGTGLGIQLINGSNHAIGVPTISPSGVSLVAATGTACAGCTVEVFKAAPNAADASGGAAGQGKVFLGSNVVPASGAFTVGFSSALNPGDPVTATVTSAPGDTSQFSSNVAAASISSPTPPAPPATPPPPTLTTYASDTFSRSLTAAWGRADIGGNYAGFYCTNVDENVTGSAATVLLPDPHNPTICPKNSTVNGNYRGGYLTNVFAQDVDVRFRVKTATLAAGDNINVGFDVRRVSGFTSYRGQVRLTTGNQVWLQADTVLNNTMTGLGVNTRAMGASVSTSTFIWVRGQLTGTNPTTIRMKAWNDGSPEPAAWDYTTIDSTAVLQAPGAAGLVGWQSAASTTGPVTESFDDFNVTSQISGTIPAAPIANFSSAQVVNTLNVRFTDATTGGTPTAWWYDFGDGTGSATASPTHTYPGPGTYTVKLTSTNDGGSSAKSSAITVNPLPGVPVANFTAVQQPGTLAFQFTDTSTGGTPTSWAWTFGDGGTSSNQNPIHAYSAAGPENVTLHATNLSGTGSITIPITVNPIPVPVSNFTFAQVGGTQTVNFTDTSTNSPTSWAWDFGDSSTSTSQSPSHIYANPGPYTVTLTASNAGGPSVSPASQSITVTAPLPVPVASFTSLQTPGTLGVAFTDTSSNTPTSWSWTFGDGSPLSTVQNPSHAYSAPGNYSVTLTATNASGPSTPLTVGISVVIPVPASSYTFVQTPGTNTVTFTDTSTNSPNSWAWDFGDSTTSTTQSPVHTFLNPGPYTVTLTASNSSGPGSLASQTVTVVAGPYASDTFNRAAASGTWGTAQTGGAWTYVGTTADFSLTGTAGAINLGAAGATRAAYLPVNVQDVDLAFQFNVSKLPTGGGSVYAYGSVRRSATADYRIKVRIFGTGAVYLSISQFSAGTEVTLGSEVQVIGLTAVVGQDLKVHAVVSGLTPTTLSARVWAASGSEPGTWQLTKTDSTAALQVPGSVGVRAYTSGTTTNNPIIETFDNFSASPIAPLVAPTASFTYVQQAGTLSVQFTDTSTSTPTSWAWTFGDGGTSTVQNPLHTFTTSGPKTVTLAATNATGTGMTPQPVTVNPLPVPASSYTFVQTPGTNTVTFTDTSTNSPNSWAWDFGDSTTSTTQSPVHTFLNPGPYTVTLTASNSSGPGSLASQTVTVVAGPYASDTFNRAAASGTWGTAQTGGAWTYVGTTADFSLTGTAGAINLGAAGATRAAYLPVNVQDVDLAFQFNVSKLPTGGGSVYAYGSVRRSATADYRIKVRIFGTGAVYLSISQFSAGTEVTLGSEVQVIGLTAVVGQDLKVHAVVSGLTPTTLSARVWAASGSEPGTWQLTKTDSTAALQVPGSVGVRAYTSGTTTNNPIIETFDNFVASPL